MPLANWGSKRSWPAPRASKARWLPRWPTSSRRSPPTWTCRRSSRPQSRPAPTPSIPATGSCPRMRASRRRRSPPASCGSGRRPRRCARSATRSERACSPNRPACRSSLARPATTTRCSAAAVELGVPLLVKAAAGGGGRGMRAVDHLDDLPAAIAAAHREAAAAFGDDRVFLERRLGEARHVEVQILADTHGDVIQPRRAGLLAAAPPPEGGRGIARARGVPRPSDPSRRGRRARSHGLPATWVRGPSSSCCCPTARSDSWR